jgi:hypothetical protein
LCRALGHLLDTAAPGALTYILFVRHIRAGFAVSLFAFATACSFTNRACHELSHGTVFRTILVVGGEK